jgi:hypothetical protein
MEIAINNNSSHYSHGVKFLGLSAGALPFLIYVNPGGVPIFIGYFPFILLIFVILHQGYYPINLSPVGVPIFTMLCLFVISIGIAVDLGAALVRIAHITIGFLAFIVVINIVRTENDIDFILKTIQSTGFIIAGLGIGFWILTNIFHSTTFLNLTYGGPFGPWLYGSHNAAEFKKYYEMGSAYSLLKGTGKESEFLGYYASIGLFALPVINGIYSSILILIDLVYYRNWNFRRYLFQSMLWINLFLTQSRTSWISLMAALIMHWWWNYKEERIKVSTRAKKRTLKIGIAVLCALAFITVFIGIENMLLQISSPVRAVMVESTDAGTTMGRLIEIYKFVDVMFTYPLTGVGFDKSLGSKYADVDWEFRTHNEYFNMGIFSGVFGLLAYISFLAIPFAYSFKLTRLPYHTTLQGMGRLFKRLAVLWAVSAIGTGRLDNPKDYLPYWVLTGLVMSAVIIAGSLNKEVRLRR